MKTLLRWVSALFVLQASLLGGCVFEEAKEGTTRAPGEAFPEGVDLAATTEVSSASADLAPPDCDPNHDCEVAGPQVQCASGPAMNAWQTSDGRWCINRDACGWNNPICPF
ncbi:hypothetical protein [Chondromyces crocatus]|uniref:Lipoprotein n=1 Tax=Chondromyces crocatus TaxID=52 RepID=A0A0K1EM70_CHOCO|nr:hypothetical protein [Chondromyces crocatus]AKT41911.1 uncharacterized protein CMC5_061330 [Chondromyces crocatus]